MVNCPDLDELCDSERHSAWRLHSSDSFQPTPWSAPPRRIARTSFVRRKRPLRLPSNTLASPSRTERPLRSSISTSARARRLPCLAQEPRASGLPCSVRVELPAVACTVASTPRLQARLAI